MYFLIASSFSIMYSNAAPNCMLLLLIPSTQQFQSRINSFLNFFQPYSMKILQIS
jgi:hypothetical protein